MKSKNLNVRTIALMVAFCLCAAVYAGAIEASAGERSPFVRSLVSRMLDARDGAVAPKKGMWYVKAKPLDAAEWPFDLARVEGLLEKTMVRTPPGGPYRLRRQTDEADQRKAGADALAYVNKIICEWAVMSLDSKFQRCDADTIKTLGAYRVDLDKDFWSNYAILTKSGAVGGGSSKAGGWITAWKVAKDLYLVLTSELAKECNPRDYQFVMWDGEKDWPIVGFDSFPDAARFALVKSLLDDPGSANNLAALVHSRDANRSAYMREYVESLLRRSAAGGCDAAFHNLGVLMEERGLAEESEAFYSRERAKSSERRGD